MALKLRGAIRKLRHFPSIPNRTKRDRVAPLWIRSIFDEGYSVEPKLKNDPYCLPNVHARPSNTRSHTHALYVVHLQLVECPVRHTPASLIKCIMRLNRRWGKATNNDEDGRRRTRGRWRWERCVIQLLLICIIKCIRRRHNQPYTFKLPNVHSLTHTHKHASASW